MFLERKFSCSFINLVGSLQHDISLPSVHRWVSVCGFSYTYMSTWAWLYFGEIRRGKANSCSLCQKYFVNEESEIGACHNWVCGEKNKQPNNLINVEICFHAKNDDLSQLYREKFLCFSACYVVLDIAP